MSTAIAPQKKDPYAVWRIRDFRFFVFGRFFVTISTQMQAIIVGWQIYELTKDVLSLGLIGLAEAIPFIVTSLFSGFVADMYRRKNIILIASVFMFMTSAILLYFSSRLSGVLQLYGVLPVYILIFIAGIARGFYFPAQSAFMAQIVPRELYPNSSTWNSAIWHIAAITGPAIGGLIYGFWGVTASYMAVVVSIMIGFTLLVYVKSRPVPERKMGESLFSNLSAGLKFVFNHQIILSALALDMFAVLFGGAVALLPVFAGEILKVGPQGLGFLRAAPAAGAVLMSLFLAYRPPMQNSGKILLIGVAGFGLSYLLFALSDYFYLSLFLLLLSGVFDNVSVVIRSTILQLLTPDHMRGRVAAVNSIFIGSSNELGAFESGLVARLMGVVPSVIFGSCMTFVVVGSVAGFAPKIRKLSLKQEIEKAGN
ncbi:MAG: MFS transporter [Bacteroidota bacterium]